ncbi:MAG: S8 family serine peptidase [Gemmatimonadetes bacterium]|nr:S8 family serine peptidase [Gemmatimonadota bacterium]
MTPQVARLAGLMPLRSTGIESFRQRDPAADGRGVLIAVLDGGIDPGVAGMRTTSTGERKLLDLRDFSGEGRIGLSLVRPDRADTIAVEGHQLAGFGRIARLAAAPYFGGVLGEARLGSGPAADLNGDGDREDEFPIVVARASDGWFMVTDTDGDGSLDDERPVHDYALGAETFAYGSQPMTLAANLAEASGRPVLDLFFDNSSHGTHVAGIAAGYQLFGVEGFDGVAPGAQVLGLKIADNRWGKISVTGSMVRAMEYAAGVAARRSMPLVINLSYGVGNAVEGAAVIDSLLDAFAARHPDVLVVVSAGNDGPGISTVGFPASADLALSVCALVPGVFARAPEPDLPPAPDVLSWWSARGGELAKPDLCAPGVAFSTVPPWRVGEEIAGGTSQAAPQVAGMAALLQSASARDGRRLRAVDLKRALMATAVPLPGVTTLDQGFGVPHVQAAHQWLLASHQAGIYVVRALPDGGNASRASAAYRRNGLASPSDTVQRFQVSTLGGQAAARLLLTSDAEWLRTPPQIELSGQPAVVSLTYDPARLSRPGLYVGNVWARAASDTLAGRVFRLTNTVVVPYHLEPPLTVTRSLEPGNIDRFFVRVPPDAGGLRVSLGVSSGRSAMLSLFEPSGQPARSAGSVDATAGDSASVSVTGEDLLPGVYEAVVVAPPGSRVTYRFTAVLPRVAVRAVGTGPSAVLVSRAPDSARVGVTARVAGAAREYQIRGGGDPASLQIPVPPWADRVVLDVSLSEDLWNQVTDVGLLVRQAAGRELNEQPLEYRFARRTLALDSTSRADPLTLSLLPAFARTAPRTGWQATVRVAFLRQESLPLDVLGMGPVGHVVLPPGGTLGLQFSPVPPEVDLPPEYAPLVDVVAEPQSGPAASRRAAVSPSTGSP